MVTQTNQQEKSKDKQKGASRHLNWDNVKESYLNEKLSLKEICKKFGMTQYQLLQKRQKENWPKRKTISKQTIKKQLIKTSKAGKNTRAVKQSLKAETTLFESLEFITMELINRISHRQLDETTYFERDARTLSSLVRTYEKLKKLEQTGQAKQERHEQTKSDQSQDEKRKELAARLEKLIKGL